MEITTRIQLVQSLPGVEFVRAAYRSHHFPRHFHDHYVIQLVETGVNKGVCRGIPYAVESDTIMVINPGEVHDGFSHEGQYLAYHSLYITPAAMKLVLEWTEIDTDRQVEFSELHIRNPESSQSMKELVAALVKPDPFEIQTRMLILLRDLVLNYTTVTDADPSFRPDSRLRRAVEYLHTNYAGSPTLEQLGAVVGLSPFYLIKMFKQHIGLTPFDYLRNCRIEQVKLRLKSSQSIADTAIETGFYDQSHLNLVFKRHTGLTPRQYQKMTSA